MNTSNSESMLDQASHPNRSQRRGMTSRQKMILRAVLVIAPLIFIAAAWRGFSGGVIASSDDGDRPVGAAPVRVFTVKESNFFTIKSKFAGVIKPTEASSLGFELGGEVKEILVEDGDQVEKGDVIARLDKRRIEARKKEIEGQLDSAQAMLDELKAGPREEIKEAARANVRQLQSRHSLALGKLNRANELVNDNALSQEEREERDFEVQSLKAQLDEAQAKLDELENGTRAEVIAAQRGVVEQLQATLDQVEIEIDQSELKAPFRGVVVERSIDSGTIVAAGQEVVQLESLGREAWIGFPPEVVDSLDRNQDYPVQIEARTMEAPITKVIPRVQRSTRTQTVIIRLPEAASNIPTGVIAQVEVEQRKSATGYWVPVSALSPGSHGLWAAYVIVDSEGEESSVARRDVELIHLDSERAFVAGTFKDGEEVILEGVHRLANGQSVSAVRVANPWADESED